MRSLTISVVLWAVACGCQKTPLDAPAVQPAKQPPAISTSSDDTAAKQVAQGEHIKPTPISNGNDLDGWRIADANAYEEPGKVFVKDGIIVMEQGRIATGIAYAKDDFPRMNYEVSLEARRTGGTDFFCGMTFPIGQQHCTLICGGWGGGTTGLSNVDHFSADENSTTGFVEFENDHWYQIRLRVTEERVQAWIDKEQIIDLDAKDKHFDIWWEQEPLRPFGIGNWYTTSELRAITLRRLPSEGTD